MSPLFRNFLFVILGLTFTGYLVFQLRGFFLAPSLSLFEPAQGSHFYSSRVIVSGKTVDAALLTVNGRRIFTDEKGNFEEELVLPYGLNVISVSAERKFGKRFTDERIVYVTGYPTEEDEK